MNEFTEKPSAIPAVLAVGFVTLSLRVDVSYEQVSVPERVVVPVQVGVVVEIWCVVVAVFQ